MIIGLVGVALVLFALIDLITREEWQVRHLPKLTWVCVILFLPVIGSIIWLLVGREWSTPGDAIPFGHPSRHEQAGSRVVESPTAVELAALDAEIAFAERDARIRQLEAELEARQRSDDSRG